MCQLYMQSIQYLQLLKKYQWFYLINIQLNHNYEKQEDLSSFILKFNNLLHQLMFLIPSNIQLLFLSLLLGFHPIHLLLIKMKKLERPKMNLNSNHGNHEYMYEEILGQNQALQQCNQLVYFYELQDHLLHVYVLLHQLNN